MRFTRPCCIVPPYVLRSIAEHGDDEDRVRAIATLRWSSGPRREREALTQLAGTLVLPPRVKRRTVHDAGGGRILPGRTVRTEGERRSRDSSVNEAYEASGRTHDYFRRIHGRRSVDDRGMGIRSTVHFGNGVNNAHWDGRQLIFGDGDGKYFHRFTACLDVVAHELTHGVTQYTAALGRSGQCGALAEHFADVFGILVRQHALRETAGGSDWLIGAGLFTERVLGQAIRSMKAPGTAYDDPILGRDPQPAHWRDYVVMHGDDRGVHVNSGIPNHAFYRVASMLGGYAWEIAGRIWYHALTRELGPRAQFQQCANSTWLAAGVLFGNGSAPQDAVLAGWREVGIEIAALARPTPARAAKPRKREPVSLPVGGAELPRLG